MDGANVEIRERVGAENFFLFGMTVDEVDKLYEDGCSPAKYYEADPRLKAAIDMVSDGTFSNGDRNTYAPLRPHSAHQGLVHDPRGLHRLPSIQSEIEALYRDPLEWNRKAVLNVANSGYFSSDRSIQDYLEAPGTPPRWPDCGASSSLLLSRGTFVPFPSVRLEDAHVISPPGCACLPTDGV